MSHRRLALLFVLVTVSLGVTRPKGLSDVVEVRHWSYPDYTRVVIELTEPVTTEVRHLGADHLANKSERLYLDLPGVWVGRDYASGIPVGDGLLQGVRLGQNTLHTARVVIDVEHYDRHRLMFLVHPDRVVIDVYGHRDRAETLRWPDRDGSGKPEGRLSPETRGVRTVIVDPGHGGSDPGAIGVGGLLEKHVTLRLARSLVEKLKEAGFRVVLTRTGDQAVSLEERTAIAEAAHGDVFVSLHANAASRRSVRGIETYFPDQDHARHSLRVAMRENGVTREQLDDLQRTLSKFRMAEISPRSKHLASLVQSEITRELRERYGSIEDLGAKKGPFYVLFLSNMPAILVEAGFVTNRAEAKRLNNADYLESVASQIARGLARYRDSETTLARQVPR